MHAEWCCCGLEISLSFAEAVFIAASALVQEVIYTRRLLKNLGFSQKEPTSFYEDNLTCIAAAWSEVTVGGSDRAKPIDLREHFVHDAVEAKILKRMPVNIRVYVSSSYHDQWDVGLGPRSASESLRDLNSWMSASESSES